MSCKDCEEGILEENKDNIREEITQIITVMVRIFEKVWFADLLNKCLEGEE